MEAAISTYAIPILLGLGLAASTGLRTFLPLLMLAVAGRLDLFGVDLNDKMAWLVSDAAIGALGVAAVAEFIGDKVPVIDHFLNAVGFVARPLAAIVAAYAVFGEMDPMIAAVAAVIIGAPTALTFNAAQGGTRLASTAATGGLGNPVVSFLEDVLAFLTVLVAFLLPVLIPVVLALLLWLVWKLARKVRPSRSPQTSGGS